MIGFEKKVNDLQFNGDFGNDLIDQVYSTINSIITEYPSYESEIIEFLSPNLKLIYIMAEIETIIGNDGLMAIFINCDLKKINQFVAAIESIGEKKYTKFFMKAKGLVEEKYPLDLSHSWSNKFPEDDVEEFFSVKLLSKIEKIEEKLNDLQDKGEYWNIIKKLYQADFR